MIDKTMIIADIIAKDPESAKVFFANGLFCVGCPAASAESVEEACRAHGLEADKLITALNAYFADKNK